MMLPGPALAAALERIDFARQARAARARHRGGEAAARAFAALMSDGAVRRADATARVDVLLNDVGRRFGRRVDAAFVRARIAGGHIRFSTARGEDDRNHAEHTQDARRKHETHGGGDRAILQDCAAWRARSPKC